jgi:hypothetical protein
MHSSLQFFLDCSQPGPYPISARLPLKLKGALAGSTTGVSKPNGDLFDYHLEISSAEENLNSHSGVLVSSDLAF